MIVNNQGDEFIMKVCQNCNKMVENIKTVCPYCGSNRLVSFVFPKDNTNHKLNMNSAFKRNISIITILILIGVVTFSYSIMTDKNTKPVINNVTTSAPAQPNKTVHVSITNYGEKHKEILNAFNMLLSGNDFSPIYDGVRHDENVDELTVYVNNNWNLLSKDDKLAFIKCCFIGWATPTKSRNIKFEPSNFSLIIKSRDSDRKLASWGSVRGPVLYDE